MQPGAVIEVLTAGRSRRRMLVGLYACFAGALALLLSVVSFALADDAGFPDVPSTHPYYRSIMKLADLGIVEGYADGDFGPDDPVTRQQFAKMIVLTAGYPVSEGDICPFTDVAMSDSTSFYPDNYVGVCAARGISLGKTTAIFDPYAYITRYQVVSMMVRAGDSWLRDVSSDSSTRFTSRAGWDNDPTHGANAARAGYNGLLVGLDLTAIDPYGNMNRGEVALVLSNYLYLFVQYMMPFITVPTVPTTTITAP